MLTLSGIIVQILKALKNLHLEAVEIVIGSVLGEAIKV